MAFPGFGVGIGLADKKNLALVLFMRIRINEKNGFLLLDSSQVEQVRIRPQQQRSVGVGWQDVIGVDYCQGIRQQQLLELSAVGLEDLGVDRGVFHRAVMLDSMGYPTDLSWFDLTVGL